MNTTHLATKKQFHLRKALAADFKVEKNRIKKRGAATAD